jgi:hypothetical protein
MPRVATAEGSIISVNIHLENKFLGGICICAPRKNKSDRVYRGAKSHMSASDEH